MTSKKKILYVITKSNWGGAQRYVYDLATSLPKKDFDVAVVHGGEGALSLKLKSRGVRTISIPFLERDIRLGDELKTLLELIRLFRTEKPDIIHLNSSKIGGLGALGGRIARMPRIIFTAHGWYFKEDRPWPVRHVTRFLSWLTVLFSHTVIVVSDDDKRHSPRLAVREKVVRIHNGLSGEKTLERSTARQKIKRLLGNTVIPRGAHWVGTISELHHNKGLNYTIEAIANLRARGKEVLFFIIGGGEDLAILKALIAQHGLEDCVFLLGYIDNAPSLLSAFDTFTLTATKEGFPYALLEAGAAGIPTIASAVGGIPEIIVDMESGILTRPKESDEVTKALCYLIDNDTKRKELGSALQRHVHTHFTKSRMLANTLALY